MADVVTIKEAVQRSNAEGIPVTEYTLRKWVRAGAIPTRKVGQKALLFYPNLVRFIQCEDGCDNEPHPVAAASGIRRIDV